jgi:isochorismate synthase
LTLGPSVKCRGLTPSSYERQVSDALDAIEAGDLTKVTVARSETWRTGEQIRPEELLDRLSARFPDCFVFCVEPAGGAAFVGASPERLVAVRGGVVEADALAGTVARAEDDDDDDELARALSDSDKEQREHRVVVDYLRTSLAPVVESVDHPAQPGLLRLANVQHLHTPVQGRLLNGEGAIDLAGLVHPTPAVCGLPRERAQGWLERREELDRGWYAGGVGVVSRDGDGEFCVAIRSGLLRDDVAVLFAGAGIVAGSRPESEADEVDHKLRGMREVLFDAVA